ncbi:MAG: 3-ketoacyl-ACP reductase [Defluviitaleaceae bacterium]|nr:3-ketoacyl-ACP reductase [Defluviitaleaceae bacterium]
MQPQTKPTAVVTGATRGIGLAIADSLQQAGYNVVRAARSSQPSYDISKTNDREQLLADTIAMYGRVDLLVNNAGVAPATRLDILETTDESFQRVLRINLEATFFMCQLFARHMISQPKGHPCRIINIASISSYTSSVNRGEYCISKAGISMVTKLFADRLAEYGIGVYEIRPGIILTDMTEKVKDKYTKLIEEGLTPTKRMGTPQDVADAVLGITGGHYDFATGQVFNIDGGFHIRRL